MVAVIVISGQSVPAWPGLWGLGAPGAWPGLGWAWLAGGETAQSGGEVVEVSTTAAPGELETVSLSRQVIPGDTMEVISLKVSSRTAAHHLATFPLQGPGSGSSEQGPGGDL